MRGAPFGLRPCRIRKPLEIKRCRERPMCRSALIERDLLTYSYRKRRFIPPHQSLTRQLPPKGKPSVGSANCIKSASNFNNSYFQRITHSIGRNPQGAPRIPPLSLRPFTKLNHFYPVAEKAQAPKSRWTGFGSEQPEFAARNTATPESAQ